MTRKLTLSMFAVLLVIRPFPAPAVDAPISKVVRPSFVLLDFAALSKLKQRVAANDPAVRAAVDSLKAEANAALLKQPPTVTEKKTLPVGNDVHDYMSLAIYFWPDPSKPNGKPYMNRDGVVNRAEVNEYDAPRKDRMIKGVRGMAMAYYLTGDEKYAQGAAKYLRAWFLDEPTRMNPNLDHAQFVPGSNEGRGFGIIETRAFVHLVDAVSLLHDSSAWTDADDQGFRAWMNAFVDWLQTSKNGRDEANATNNHGQWYDMQLAGLARYLERDDVVLRVVSENGPKRIADQVAPDGSLPKELTRTRSLHYSLFAIDAWVQLAEIGKSSGFDLYNFRTADGRGIKPALDFMTPFLLGEKKWEHQMIGEDNSRDYRGTFHRAARAYGDTRFAAVAERLDKKDAPPSIDDLLQE
jgi:hypothetical protein